MKKLIITLALAAAALIPALADSRFWTETDLNATGGNQMYDTVTYSDPETGADVVANRTWFYPYSSIFPYSTIGKAKIATLGTDSTGGWKGRFYNPQIQLVWATTYTTREWVWVPNALIPIYGGSWQVQPVVHYETGYTYQAGWQVDKTKQFVPPVPPQ